MIPCVPVLQLLKSTAQAMAPVATALVAPKHRNAPTQILRAATAPCSIEHEPLNAPA